LKQYRPDIVITSFERKWIPHSLGIPAYVPYTFSFYQGITGALLAAKEIYAEYSRKGLKRPPPIYAKSDLYAYDQKRFPLPCDLMPAVRLWEDVRYVRQ